VSSCEQHRQSFGIYREVSYLTCIVHFLMFMFAALSDDWRWRLITSYCHLPTSSTECLPTASITGAELSPSMHLLAGWLGTAAVVEHVMHRQRAKCPGMIENLPGVLQPVLVITWPYDYRPGYRSRADGWVGVLLSIRHASCNSSNISLADLSDLSALVSWQEKTPRIVYLMPPFCHKFSKYSRLLHPTVLRLYLTGFTHCA